MQEQNSTGVFKSLFISWRRIRLYFQLDYVFAVISAVKWSLFSADFGTDVSPNLHLDSWQSETQMSLDQFLLVYKLCSFVCACHSQNLYRRKPGLFLNCARLPENMDKNRYRDVLPCKLLQPLLHHHHPYSFWPWCGAALAQDEILSARARGTQTVWSWPPRSALPCPFRRFHQGGPSGPGELHQRQPHHGAHLR